MQYTCFQENVSDFKRPNPHNLDVTPNSSSPD
jgi:hypothetical protein